MGGGGEVGGEKGCVLGFVLRDAVCLVTGKKFVLLIKGGATKLSWGFLCLLSSSNCSILSKFPGFVRIFWGLPIVSRAISSFSLSFWMKSSGFSPSIMYVFWYHPFTFLDSIDVVPYYQLPPLCEFGGQILW